MLALAYLNSYYQTGLEEPARSSPCSSTRSCSDELAIDKAYGKVDEIPFDFMRRRMSVVVDHEASTTIMLICKGAVEEILAVCTHVRDDDAQARSRARRPSRRRARRDLVAELNEDGLRVVAVAYREFPTDARRRTRVADESELDARRVHRLSRSAEGDARPRRSRRSREHGVAVKILTGDNELVTRKICRDVGLDVEHIVLGSETRGARRRRVGELGRAHHGVRQAHARCRRRASCARCKARGHTVGFLGDGINDAGALREADVGISVDSRRRHRQGVGRHHPAREEPDGARGGRHRRAQDLRQHRSSTSR